MSVKALKEINHNGASYHCGDIILDITKEEAERLIKLKAAEIADNKFRRSRKSIRNSIVSTSKQARRSEESWIHGV